MNSARVVILDKWKRARGIEMSVIAMNYVRKVRGISIGARGLLLTLANYYNDEELYAWPTRELLADEFGVSERTVDNWIRELKDRDLVQVVRHPTYRNNCYMMEAVESLLEERRVQAVENSRARRR
jgi:hypothetical protein